MLAITEYATNERPPACARCGGTGFVYLWSIAADGSRTWFCDRSRCKVFWQDAGRRQPTVATVANGAVVVAETPPAPPIPVQPKLQPV